MPLDDTDPEEGTTHPADPPQPLVDLVSGLDDPQARSVVRDAAVRIQDYLTKRQIASDNDAAANRLIGNLGNFKDGLANLAASDPAAVDLGVKVAPGMIDGFVDVNPYLPEDQKGEIANSLTQNIQQEVVRSGVMSAADRSETQARRLLEAHGDLLSDGDRLSLNGYIDTMATARNLDAAADATQQARDNARLTNNATVKYLDALVDPATGEAQFPRGWAQHVTSDNSLPPGTTAAMLHVYNNVRNGDGETDWNTFADMTNRIANGQPVPLNEIFSNIGDGLKLADAAQLSRGSIDSVSPVARNEMKQLDATIQAARQVLAPPEYGVAGQRAFDRFMSWMVPQYRSGGPGSLNPNSEGYILPNGEAHEVGVFWNQFAPRLDDFVTTQNFPRDLGQLKEDTGDRMSLEEIFGGPKRTTADRVLNTGRQFNPNRIPIRRAPDLPNVGNPEIES